MYIKQIKQEFWLRGGGREIFFQRQGVCKALVGAQGAKPPEAPEFLILGIKFNHINSPDRWSYTLSYKQKCPFIDTL